MKVVKCPDGCGRKLRPCNVARHRKAQHTPRLSRPRYTKIQPPTVPIRLGKDTDRRYDEVLPRGEGPHRYRIYRLRAGELEIVASAPDAECMGYALAHLAGEGEFTTDDSAGILDTATDPGHWCVNPWALGRRPPE
jgi:hypothetical protein